MTSRIDQVLRTGEHLRVPRVAAVVRVVTGVLYVYFGIPKFTAHEGWVSSFESWGVPLPTLSVYGTGTVEVLGGLALVVGAFVGPVAALLALVMVGAIVFGGLIGGSAGSLTLAPALLVATLFVLWTAREVVPRRHAPT